MIDLSLNNKEIDLNSKEKSGEKVAIRNNNTELEFVSNKNGVLFS